MGKHRTYEENMYAYLKRQGLDKKYEHAGIYSIRIDDQLVYIGKSDNMLRRISQHYVAIKRQSTKKYRILAESQRRGHTVKFDVLYYAKSNHTADITEEIGAIEGAFIRKYRPALNYQIPKAENWHQYTVNKAFATITLDDILKENPDE